MEETANNFFDRIRAAFTDNLKSKSIDTNLASDLLKETTKKLQYVVELLKKNQKTTEKFHTDFLKGSVYVTEFKKLQNKISDLSSLKPLYNQPFLIPEQASEQEPELNLSEQKENSFLNRITKFLGLGNKQTDTLLSSPKNSEVDKQTNISATNLENDDDIEAGREKIIDRPEKLFLLDGITPTGASQLTNILAPIFDESFKKIKPAVKEETKETKKRDSDKGFFEQIGSELKQSVSALTTAGSVLVRALPMLAKVAGPLAAIAGGEIIGGKIGQVLGEFLYGEEGKEAYEKYGTGVTGLLRASYDYYQQTQEQKETEERGKRIEASAVERSKQSLEGTRVAQDAEQHQKATEKISKQLQDAQVHETKMQDQLKAVEEKSFWERESGELDTAQQNLDTAKLQVQMLQNRLTELEKVSPSKAESKQEPKPDVQLKDGGVVTKPVNALIGEAGPEVVIPLKNNNTSNPTITNSNPETSNSVLPLNRFFNTESSRVSNDTLNKIASNTSDTNSALKLLTDAIFKLVTVFDKKMTGMSAGTTIINGAGGQMKEPTPASLVAANNSDPIRRVRMQFL